MELPNFIPICPYCGDVYPFFDCYNLNNYMDGEYSIVGVSHMGGCGKPYKIKARAIPTFISSKFEENSNGGNDNAD